MRLLICHHFLVRTSQPALLLRAGGGSAEQLSPTGPAPGPFEGALFGEAGLDFGPGDAFAAFSDGLTDIGPSRGAMLGVQGVADLMQRCLHPDDATADGKRGTGSVAEYPASSLVSGIDAAVRGKPL